jgi:hypothetical protein
VSYSTLVECAHCRTLSRVPNKALRLLGFERPKTELWWALFEGPSRLRSKRERMERKALAKAPPKLGIALRPNQPPGDELMQPLTRGPTAALRVLIAALLILAVIGVVLALLSRGPTPFD